MWLAKWHITDRRISLSPPSAFVGCYFAWANEKEVNPSGFELAMEQYQETLLEIVPLLISGWFSFLRSFAHVLPYSTCLQGTSLWADLPCEGPTTTSVNFSPISLFPHENCREWITSLAFLCISRAEMSNKDQTPQVVVLTKKNKLVNIFVLFFSVFSSEFSCRV